MGVPCFDLHTLVQSSTVTCATAGYITNVKEEQVSELLGTESNKYKTTWSSSPIRDTGIIHQPNALRGDRDSSWVVLEVHSGLTCIIFLSQRFGIIKPLGLSLPAQIMIVDSSQSRFPLKSTSTL